MKKFRIGEKFVNENGVIIEILEPTIFGDIQFKVGTDIRSATEESLESLLRFNGYTKKF